MSDMCNLFCKHWLRYTAIATLLAGACAGAIVQRLVAGGCFKSTPETSRSEGRGVWYAQEIRLLARIRQAGLRDRIPDEVIKMLIEIFSHDVDLQRVAQPEDGFRVYYDEIVSGRTEVLFASITYDRQTKTFYRFVGVDALAGYYDDEGRSAGKKLMRNPVEAGLLVGRFGYREPVWTGLPEFHHGIDFSAARAAPIYAAGDGAIVEARREPNNRWLVRLRHDQGYQTEYQIASLASGVEPGRHMQQGQVVGFNDAVVDGTVHYSILINERFVDPMRLLLPAEKQLQGQEFADFKEEIDQIITLAPRETPFHPMYAPP
jgi:murein DD-endopeptidase MepM/ murein hydrolase activator NlpD